MLSETLLSPQSHQRVDRDERVERTDATDAAPAEHAAEAAEATEMAPGLRASPRAAAAAATLLPVARGLAALASAAHRGDIEAPCAAAGSGS